MAEIHLDRAQAAPSETVGVLGSGFTANEQVDLYIDYVPPPVGPSATTLVVTPSTVSAGTPITLTGAHYGPNEQIFFYIDQGSLTPTSTFSDGTGAFVSNGIIASNTPSGTRTFGAHGATSGKVGNDTVAWTGSSPPPPPPPVGARDIYIANQSTMSDANVQSMMAVVQAQVNAEVVATWGPLRPEVKTIDLHFIGNSLAGVPGNEWYGRFLNDEGTPGFGGGHGAQDPHDPAYFFVNTFGTNDPSDYVCNAFSHEIIEMLVNPWPNDDDPRYSPLSNTTDSNGRHWSMEVCDPIQFNSYQASNGYKLSNFVLPSWYRQGSAGPWDYAGALTGPFQLGCGGYSYWYDGANSQTVSRTC